MTNKDHKKLGQFHLTESEKKQLRADERAEALGELVLIMVLLAAAAVVVTVIMELATR